MDALWQTVMNGWTHWHFSFWECLGWTGNVVFFSRFMIQWYYTEKRRQVVVPGAFWWLSLAGTALLFGYGLSVGNYVFIFAYAFNWIPYARNLVIHYRHQAAQQLCVSCDTTCLPAARFCHHCGTQLAPGQAT
jgi:lipid-A-disaccharide synthase-like uncharacterized protein